MVNEARSGERSFCRCGRWAFTDRLPAWNNNCRCGRKFPQKDIERAKQLCSKGGATGAASGARDAPPGRVPGEAPSTNGRKRRKKKLLADQAVEKPMSGEQERAKHLAAFQASRAFLVKAGFQIENADAEPVPPPAPPAPDVPSTQLARKSMGKVRALEQKAAKLLGRLQAQAKTVEEKHAAWQDATQQQSELQDKLAETELEIARSRQEADEQWRAARDHINAQQALGEDDGYTTAAGEAGDDEASPPTRRRVTGKKPQMPQWEKEIWSNVDTAVRQALREARLSAPSFADIAAETPVPGAGENMADMDLDVGPVERVPDQHGLVKRVMHDAFESIAKRYRDEEGRSREPPPETSLAAGAADAVGTGGARQNA